MLVRRRKKPPMVEVTIVCGSLGSGKTTLVNEMLRRSTKRVAVVENEYGEVAIDDALLCSDCVCVHGCACCGSGRRAVCVALAKLAGDPPESVILELSGVSDPSPVAKSIVIEPALRMFRLKSVVCVVDVRSFPELAPLSVRLADCVVINKIDLVEKEKLRLASAACRRLSPNSRIVHAEFGRGFKPGRFNPRRALELDPMFFRYAFSDKEHSMQTLTFTSRLTRLSEPEIEKILEVLKRADGFIRYKGVFAVDKTKQHLVCQGMRYCRESRLDKRRRWTKDNESRLVFLGHDLNKPKLIDLLKPYFDEILFV